VAVAATLAADVGETRHTAVLELLALTVVDIEVVTVNDFAWLRATWIALGLTAIGSATEDRVNVIANNSVRKANIVTRLNVIVFLRPYIY
jgi:hypothetical protein